MNLKPTIKDVANKAGVSKSTVSQYLNGRFNYMSEATRKKIEETIGELKYHPNQIAKSLKQKQTNVIAFVCATLSSRFSLELLSTIESFYQKENYSVIIASTEDNPEKERELIDSFIARQVDGLIIFPTQNNFEFYQEVWNRNIPIVFVDRILESGQIPSVLLDNEAAAAMATQLMVDNGHTDIAIFTFPLGNHITARIERIKGYEKNLDKNGIPVKKANIISCTVEQVGENLTQLFQRKQAPTAVILTNDLLLEAALLWVKENKLEIPEVFSIIGIDDVSFARFFSPEITTLAQPITKIGLKAAGLLLQQIKGENGSEVSQQIYRYSPKLIQRDSIKEIG